VEKGAKNPLLMKDMLRQKQNRKKTYLSKLSFLIPMYRKEFDACDMIAARIEEVLIE